jgi:hypothetical protein
MLKKKKNQEVSCLVECRNIMSDNVEEKSRAN